MEATHSSTQASDAAAPGKRTKTQQLPNARHRRGAQAIAATTGGGAKLSEHAMSVMEGHMLGYDLAAVDVYENRPEVGDIDAGAAAIGNKVFLAGSVDVETPRGRGLLAEEIAHTAQASDTNGTDAVTLGGTDNAAERDAGRVREAVAAGGVAPQVTTRHGGATIQRGEAGVHMNDITMPAMGLDEHHYDSPEEDSIDLDDEERRANQVYAGNLLSDISQANVPAAIDLLAAAPNGGGSKVGKGGASDIIHGVIHAFVTLELGTDAGEVAMERENVEVYEPERHMDNPMGTFASGHSVLDDSGEATRAAISPEGPGYECVVTNEPSRDQLDEAGYETSVFDGAFGGALETYAGGQYADRAQQTNETHRGSAVPGLQFENPTLYEASPSGLSRYIYNSVEASKLGYSRAASSAMAGDMRTARMHVGYADHPIQDYFSHTNFIEVCLNRYINDALSVDGGKFGHMHGRDNAAGREFLASEVSLDGPYKDVADQEGGHVTSELVSPQWVATFYDEQVSVDNADGSTERRDVITAGTFGFNDTVVSIAHTFLPLIPKLHSACMRAITTFMGMIDLAGPKVTTSSLLERLATESREGAAFSILINAMGDAGIKIPAPTGIDLGMTHLGPIPVPDGSLDVEWGGVSILTATDTFLGVYGQFKKLEDSLQSFANYIQLTSVANALQGAWDTVRQRFINEVRQGIQRLLTQIVLQITAELTDVEMTPEEFANASSANIDELLEIAQHKLHEKEEQTSLSQRLQKGGGDDALYDMTIGGKDTRAQLERSVGPVEGEGTKANPWRPKRALPPSHSEISKDHPPHDPSDHGEHEHGETLYPDQKGALITLQDVHRWMGITPGEAELPELEGGGMDEDGHGSPFFGISTALGREVMRHLYDEIDGMFAHIADNYGGPEREDATIAGADAAATRSDEMTNDHGSMVARAEVFAEERTEESEQLGQQHMQDNPGAILLPLVPQLRTLCDLIDMFVSHPDDNSWWVSVVDDYVGQNAEEVHAHIRRRNDQEAAERNK